MNELIAKLGDQKHMEAVAQNIWQWIVSTVPSILLVLILIILAHIIFRVAMGRMNKVLKKRKHEDSEERDQRVDTLTGILRKTGVITIWLIGLMILLREVGVEIGPLLAGAGIIGLAVGFGAQNLVKDIISGFFVLLEDQVNVGDVASINGTTAMVEDINLRTIVMRDLSGVVHIFPHGAITSVSNWTKGWSAMVFDIGVAYKEDTDRVCEVMTETAEEMRNDESFSSKILEPLEIFGVDEFGDSAVVIKARFKTKPLQQWAVGREYKRRLKKAFDATGIEIPFPHISIYPGEAAKSLKVAVEGKG